MPPTTSNTNSDSKGPEMPPPMPDVSELTQLPPEAMDALKTINEVGKMKAEGVKVEVEMLDELKKINKNLELVYAVLYQAVKVMGQ